jgi:1-acyl-sn-glycerol-3-phosphate acyltransferase
LAWLINFGYLSTRVIGREHVPRRGPVILAGNHSGLLDGPVVLGAAPRGVHFLIKEELVRGIGGRILLAAGQIPVARSSGRAALLTAAAVLADGRVVGIFPEGTRGTGRAESIHAGVAWLAIHTGAPVIPVACLGTRRTGEGINKIPPFRRPIRVVFGPPIPLAEARAATSTRAQISAALAEIGPTLAAHVATAESRCGIPLPTH